MRRRYLWRGIFFVIVFPAVIAHASVVRFVPLRDLVNKADVTIWGTTHTLQSYWQQGRIFTDATIIVHHVLVDNRKNLTHVELRERQFPMEVVITTLGGVVGDIGQRVDGAARLANDQEIIAHLMQSGVKNHYVPLAMAQGIWHIHRPTAILQGKLPLRLIGREPNLYFLGTSPRSPQNKENSTTMPQTLESLLSAIAHISQDTQRERH